MSNKIKKKQIQNQAQDGRSMVEMLGVLAIIGVLSIGGIAGYRMAMNRYQANQIANEINLMRTDAKMKAAQGAEELLLGSPYDDEKHLNFGSNYGVEFDFAEIGSDDASETEAGYYIKVSGVSAGVCKPLITLLNSMEDAVAVVVNEQEYTADSSADLCTEESNNALEVDFSTKDIGVSGGEKECDEATCEGYCSADGACKDCPEEAPWDEATKQCKCKSPNPHWNKEIEACAKCGDNSHCTSSSKPICQAGVCDKCTADEECIESGKGEHCSSSGSCITCGSSVSAAAWNETTRKCDYCKNVDPEKPNWSGSECVSECPEGTFLNSSQKLCVECLLDEHCQKDDVQHYWCDTDYSANYGTCTPCFKWDESTQHCQRGECESNEDCKSKGDGYYCKSRSCSGCSGDTITESCSTYKCESIENPKEKKINGKTYYLGPNSDNWWSAQRYCEALRDKKHKGSGKLVSKGELTNNKLWEALYGTCKEGDTCCTEGKLCCEADSECPAFNVNGYVWTSTPYNSESDNSCRAYYVDLGGGYVYYANRNTLAYYALCE